MDSDRSRAGSFGVKAAVVVVVSALGLGAMFYGSGIGTETSKKSPFPPVESQTHKPVRAMNLALGPMVFIARELDFAVTNAKGEKLEDSRIAARIEAQLQGIRNLYRLEIAKNPNLVGRLILQFSINPAGHVSQVKEINSRLKSSEFRQTVAAETGKWSFPELVTEPLTVQIPLLFVQEGMDITTLVHWENALDGAPEKIVATPAVKLTLTRKAKPAAPATPPAATAKPALAPQKANSNTVKTEGEQVQVKYATPLRKEPNFSAPALTTVTIGTRVTVVNRSRDWLEVRFQHTGQSGYIRKEFAVPVDVIVHR
jgi:hypothetical protein